MSFTREKSKFVEYSNSFVIENTLTHWNYNQNLIQTTARGWVRFSEIGSDWIRKIDFS